MVRNRILTVLQNRGSLTVEVAAVMIVFMLVILMSFQAFFLLLEGVNGYCDGGDLSISIEKTVESMRRWQFAGGGI